MAEKDTQAAEKARYNFNHLNTLSVVSLATSVSGFGAVAGIITGHIALSQIKDSKQGGRGLAIAGLAVGYSVLGLALVGGIARAVIGARYGFDMGGQLGNMGGQFGHMGINGGDDQGNFGGMHGGPGGFGGQDDGMPGGAGGWVPPTQIDPNNPGVTPTPSTN